MGTRKKAPRALVVDDDRFYASFVADTLTDFAGFEVFQAHSVEEALQVARKHRFNIFIVDMRMSPGKALAKADTKEGYRTGLVLARELRKLQPHAKFVMHTIASDDHLRVVTEAQGVEFLCKTSDYRLLLHHVRRVLRTPGERPRAFIVHGRDREALLELKDFLQQRLGFAKPVILAEQPGAGLTVIEKLERHAQEADVVFVLLTPDDLGHLKDESNEKHFRPRLNVVFELGYFFGILRRHSGRVLILHKGAIELPSDLGGLSYIDISLGIEHAGEEIRRQLEEYV